MPRSIRVLHRELDQLSRRVLRLKITNKGHERAYRRFKSIHPNLGTIENLLSHLVQREQLLGPDVKIPITPAEDVALDAALRFLRHVSSVRELERVVPARPAR